MRTGAGLIAALALTGLVAAGPALAQTRGSQTQPKPTTAAPPPSQPSSTPTRTAPTTMPVDPGSLSGMPAGSPARTGPDYGPGGTTTTRPRRSTAPPPEAPPADDIPYVDPPAAPGYESATDAPMKTAGGRAPPTAPSSPATPAAPSSAAASASAPDGDATVSEVIITNTPQPPSPPEPAPAPPTPPSDNQTLWIALVGLAVMLAAAALGLKHLLTPRLSFRVRMDNGVQSAPSRKDALA
ncbi:hypothetical protein QO010_002746 [Caulobacter ginsengisoli]|uniref:Uncharacterized protein n=1 Tax=Caulobacter ginsengisoli TaxID=400775 RepID=A0ABU0ISH6_9CAUL|nr:hypothetical protein [Caulobacter ginsengisoli]MDQ0464962.1 hypothetical protein [Caulobacter ginsengisoli]